MIFLFWGKLTDVIRMCFIGLRCDRKIVTEVKGFSILREINWWSGLLSLVKKKKWFNKWWVELVKILIIPKLCIFLLYFCDFFPFIVSFFPGEKVWSICAVRSPSFLCFYFLSLTWVVFISVELWKYWCCDGEYNSPAMFEGLVHQLLLGYLGRYFKDIQKQQLKIRLGMWHASTVSLVVILPIVIIFTFKEHVTSQRNPPFSPLPLNNKLK
jgi:hypothetical protein